MLFFTDEVWDLLVTETNRYANENLSQEYGTTPLQINVDGYHQVAKT